MHTAMSNTTNPPAYPSEIHITSQYSTKKHLTAHSKQSKPKKNHIWLPSIGIEAIFALFSMIYVIAIKLQQC